MKARTIIVLLFIFLFLLGTDCIGQANDYPVKNTQRIDEFLNGSVQKNICQDVIIYPSKHKKQKTRSDHFVISYINNLSGGVVTETSADSLLAKLSKQKFSVKQFTNGLIKVKDISLNGNYLKAGLRLEFIDNILVRRKINLTTSTHAKCGMYDNSIMDFKLVKDVFIKEAKVLFTVAYEEIVSDTLYLTNLELLANKHREFRFNIPGTSPTTWIDDIFTKQYKAEQSCCYSALKASDDFMRLIKEEKYQTIMDLLYSPNYFTSVNAMEALIYLSSINKVELTSGIKDRITSLKSASFKITKQMAPDAFYNIDGYSSLGMTDEKVIIKYSSSM